MEPNGPFIVVGMHRSGTSLVTRLLDELGVFMGRWTESNAEARLFLYLNGLLLRKSGGRWDHPEPIEHLVTDPERRSAFTSALDTLQRSWLRALFLGPAKSMRSSSLRDHPEPWGWKDPRNTFTAPLWLDVFPSARLIGVHRHGVDVAASLLARSRSHWARSQRLGRGTLFLAGAAAGPFARSSPVDTLTGGFNLWERYVDKTEEILTTLPTDHALQIRYEQLLEDPLHTVSRLAEFAGIAVGAGTAERLAATIRARRAFAYRDDEELVAFAESVGDRLTRRGYRA